jgi:hypothetical protein
MSAIFTDNSMCYVMICSSKFTFLCFLKMFKIKIKSKVMVFNTTFNNFSVLSWWQDQLKLNYNLIYSQTSPRGHLY